LVQKLRREKRMREEASRRRFEINIGKEVEAMTRAGAEIIDIKLGKNFQYS